MSAPGDLSLRRYAFPVGLQFFPAFVLIISFLFAFSGCLPGKVPLSAAYFSSPENALEKAASKAHLKGTLRAIARMEIITTRGRYPARVAVMLQKPSFLRVETIPLIGPPDFFLSVKGNVLKVFLPRKGEFYIGEATTKNLSSFFPISLPVEEMLSILTGTCPVLDERGQTLEGIPEGKLYRIDVTSQNKKIRSLWLDPADNHLVRVDAFADQGNILYSVKFEGFVRVENVIIPRKVTVATRGADKRSITIEYSDPQLSAETDPEVFDLPLPPGVEPIMMN
ncbi:MAG: DUF4292 domain-containing protein [Syntrophales bacterium]|nr:DUF4292 domain-containing protein [Syntrophales bacterium]